MRFFWNNAHEKFSHIKYNNWLGSEKNLKRDWERKWLFKLPKNINNIAEYGIGGGSLGETLLRKYNIKKYTVYRFSFTMFCFVKCCYKYNITNNSNEAIT